MPSRKWGKDEDNWEDQDEDNWEDDNNKDYTLPKLLGINETLIKRLKNAGYSSLWDIADAEVAELMESIGISLTTAKKIIEMANKHLETDEKLEVEENDEEEW